MPTDWCCNTSGQEYHPKKSRKWYTCMSFYIERKRTWNMWYMWVNSKVLHTALARPVGWCNLSDFRDSCEPDFSKEHCVRIDRLRGPCSAKRSLEMEEGTDWIQISRSGQRSYINVRSHASGAVSEILEKYGWQVLPHPPYSPDMSTSAFWLVPKIEETTPWEMLQKNCGGV